MRPFDYQVPASALAAVQAVAADPDAVFLGGGTNLVDHLKLGIAAPGLIVDVTSLTSDKITDDAGGLRIGAAVRNSELAADRRVRERYPVLAQALLSGASGQLRNMAITGGNPLQRTASWSPRSTSRSCRWRDARSTARSATASYAFALVSVAATLEADGGQVRDVRIALGGVAHKPWRASVLRDLAREEA